MPKVSILEFPQDEIKNKNTKPISMANFVPATLFLDAYVLSYSHYLGKHHIRAHYNSP